MKYRLRNKYSTNPDKALKEILQDRGVQDVENFLNPSSACELDPYKLKNIDHEEYNRQLDIYRKYVKTISKLPIKCYLLSLLENKIREVE